MSKFEMLDIGTVVELLNSKEYNIGVDVEHLSASKLNGLLRERMDSQFI